MDMTPLTRIVLASALNLALASLLVAAIGLLIARFVRRSAPLRHGFALGTLCLLLLLPATPIVATLINADWVPQVSLVQWPTATASWKVATDSTPTPDTGATAGLSSSATPGASASSMRTLTADEIPAGAILPGQSSPPRTAGAERRGLTPPLSTRFNLVAAGIAIVALWLLGTLFSLLLTFRGALRVTQLVRAASPVADPALLSLLDQLATQLRLQSAPSLRSSSTVGIPFAWGLASAVIVLPQPLADAGNVDQLRPVLLHELAHVRRHDVRIGLLQRIVAAMYWWNPLVCRLNANLAEAREQICDAHVLAGGCPPREYAELLVDLAARITLPQPAAAPGLLTRSEPQLTRRVQHLLEDPPMCTTLRWFGKLALMAVFILGTSTAILVAAVMVNEHRMSTFTVIPDRQVNQAYVGNTPILGSRPQPVAVPVAQPAAQSFVDNEPFFGGSEDVGSASSLDEFVPPGTPILPDDATFFAGTDKEFVEPAPSKDFEFPESDRPVDTLTKPVAEQPYDDPESGGEAPKFGTPAPDVARLTTSDPPVFIGQGSIHGLAAIELIGNDDGSLKDLRWFTESLGNDQAAATKLTERLTAFAAARPTTVYRMESRTIQDASGQTLTTYVRVPVEMNRTMSLMTGVATYGPTPDMSNKSGATLQQVLAAQITASPQLRYEHVAKAVALCEPHVQRVIIGQSDVTPEITLTLGFVRDGAGKKISSSPVLIWNDAVVAVPDFAPNDFAPKEGDQARLQALQDQHLIPVPDDGPSPVQRPVQRHSLPHDKIVDVHSLPPLLLNWRHSLSDELQLRSLTARIRADDGVDPKLVEQVVQAILPAGFERVMLEPLDASPAQNVDAVVTGFAETGDGTLFTVSIGSKNGVAIGSIFTYRPGSASVRVSGEGRASSSGSPDQYTLEVISVGPDLADCILKSGSPAPEVGTKVFLQTVEQVAPPAVEAAEEKTI